MVMIFAFSADNGNASGSKSEIVSRFITELASDIFNMNMSEAEQVEFAASIILLIRKLAHFSEYALLSILLLIGMFVNEIKKSKIYYYALGITLFYAITDEIHQLFVPGRVGSIIDIGIDFTGGIFGVLVVFIILKLKSKLMHDRSEDV